MTEITGVQRRRRLSTRSATVRLLAASLMASAAIAGGLAIQMAAGHDPALGAGTNTAQPRAGGGSAGEDGFGLFGEEQDGSSEVGEAEDGAGDFGQSASPPASVTTRSS